MTVSLAALRRGLLPLALVGLIALPAVAQENDLLSFACQFQVKPADSKVLPGEAVISYRSWQSLGMVAVSIEGQPDAPRTEAELVREGRKRISFIWDRLMSGKRPGKFPHDFRLSLNLDTKKANISVQSRGSNHGSDVAEAFGRCTPVEG